MDIDGGDECDDFEFMDKNLFDDDGDDGDPDSEAQSFSEDSTPATPMNVDESLDGALAAARNDVRLTDAQNFALVWGAHNGAAARVADSV